MQDGTCWRAGLALTTTSRNAQQDEHIETTKEYHRYDYWLSKQPGEASVEYFDRSSEEESPNNSFLTEDRLHFHNNKQAETTFTTTRDYYGSTPAANNTNTTVSAPAGYHHHSLPLEASRSWTAASTTTTSALEQDVLVRVGPLQHEFRHSSAMLFYASHTLSRHLRPYDTTSTTPSNMSSSISNHHPAFVLDIPHKTPAEWKQIQAFLQPRSVQAAAITPDNLPTLLPWFDQLQLTVLLQECDVLLSSLEWPTALPPLSPMVSPVVSPSPSLTSGDNHIIDRPFSPPAPLHSSSKSPSPTVQDVADLLQLVRITSKASLPASRTKGLAILATYLQWQSGLFATRLELVEQLAEILILMHDQQQKVRWRTVVEYLPTDLPVFTDPTGLLQNPLFPYLLREGLKDSDDDARRHPKCCSDGPQQLLLEDCGFVEDPTTASRGVNLCGGGNKHRCDSFEQWWNTWSSSSTGTKQQQQHAANCCQTSDVMKDVITCRVLDDHDDDDDIPVRRGRSRRRRRNTNRSQEETKNNLATTPIRKNNNSNNHTATESRAAWLDRIWLALNEPEIFQSTPDNSFSVDEAPRSAVTPEGDPPPPRQRHRTFAC